MVKKIGVGVGVVVIAIGYLYVYVIGPGQADVHFCQQFVSVMDATHNLTTAPTPEQMQLLKTSVEGLANVSHGSVSFPGASAAAALMRDVNAVGSTVSPDEALRVGQDADTVAAACRSDSG